jgi:hypothetical protein
VFMFARKLAFVDISKFNNILFNLFGSRCRGMPNLGFASVMFNSVPCF